MIKKYSIIAIFLLMISSIFLISCQKIKIASTSSMKLNPHELRVHYIDVGQGDSILVQINNKNLLIDAGPNSSEDKLIMYLKSLSIKKLDYVIATHPHEDHIGGMEKILNLFDVAKFYAPKVTTDTKTFKAMISELKSKSLKINILKNNLEHNIDLGNNTKVEIFSPIDEKYDNLNNYSPIIKITYKNNSFLFTGDAEKLVEKEVLQKNFNLKADVLKIAHHGSTTSTTKEFLEKVSPSIAVISVGAGNDYGHPHKEILKILENHNIITYRTDLNGTIILSSDGENITKE